ncbi:S41 family peptidase [Saccharicrinis sp. FJH54]|uniref:S41 family peptidase n=1 Tax=Saccharicrinis sp. FJH54 TaxID=3344665 RepID=UPI0035D45D55
MKIKYFIIPVLSLLFVATSCNKNKLDEKVASVNEWIWQEMNTWYLWTSNMPSYERTDIDPTTYFNSLLYTAKDKWSFITDNYRELINSFQGREKAMGYSLALYYKDAEQKDVVGYVEFVYPNTPAASAGIKRGDIIGSVNGQVLNNDNYIDLLFYTDNQTLGYLDYTGTGYTNSEKTISVSSQYIDENPVVKDTIYTFSGKSIGYLAYVGFISNFNDKLDEVFTKFKENNVKELILDLRYNPGGDLGAANYLCSSIVPESDVTSSKRLVNFNWNSYVQQAYTDLEADYNLYINFINDTKINMNLPRIYILTTRGTASASELTITGLEPYMDVITIGESTHGKYAASITIPDDDSIWALQPIVLKYSNADGLTDFEDGLSPDYEIKDYIEYPLGDTRDQMIAKAVSLITGEPLTETKSKNLRPHTGVYFKSAGRNPQITDGLLNIGKTNIKFE